MQKVLIKRANTWWLGSSEENIKYATVATLTELHRQTDTMGKESPLKDQTPGIKKRRRSGALIGRNLQRGAGHPINESENCAEKRNKILGE